MKNEKEKSKRTFSWVNPKLEVKETGKYGKGLFAKNKIKKDEIVIAFGGYIMTTEEFYKLPSDIMHYPSQIYDNLLIGIKHRNEIEDGYYLNHSCEPNVGHKGQIFMVAMRNIKRGEEVSFDYGMEWYPEKIKLFKGKKKYASMQCNCGSRKCRKIITENDWKIPELQKRYDGYFQWFIQEKINKLKK